MPDLTISNVVAPATGQAGQTVDVNYTVSNEWNASSGAFESQFILSTDQIYDGWSDILISQSQSEGDLSENSSRNVSAQVTIPSNTANGTYYWIVWADGGIARNSHLR
jgi:subtilase family serine protease